MTFASQQGPTNGSCYGCKHIQRQMVKTGTNPVFEFTCKDQNKTIGNIPQVPEWCRVG